MLYESRNRWTVQHYQRKMCLECQRKGPPKILEFHMQEAGYLRQSHFRFVFSGHVPKTTSLSKLNGRKKFCYISTAIPSTALFFSAISTQEKKKESINDESEDSEQKHDQSSVPSTSSQQWLDGNPTSINKSLWPAITYWLALATPNEAPANPLLVHRALLECGMGVTATQVIPMCKTDVKT